MMMMIMKWSEAGGAHATVLIIPGKYYITGVPVLYSN